MGKDKNDTKIYPKLPNGSINLPSEKEIKIDKNTVTNSGTVTPNNVLFKSLRESIKNDVFPPITQEKNKNGC